MRLLQTKPGIFVKLDDDDYERLKNYKFYGRWSPTAKSWYFFRHPATGGVVGLKTGKGCIKLGNSYIHREIINAPKGMEVDHINHDSLDCQKHNLRIVTKSQNQMNRRGAQSNSILGKRGIHFDKSRMKYQVRLRLNGKDIHFGRFSSLEEAERAAIAGRKEYFGEFAGA